MKSKGGGLRTLIESFAVAISGIAESVKSERNLRIHLSAALGVWLISPFYRLSVNEFLLLVMLVAMVIVAELFNTAIEVVVDLASPSYHQLAKRAKDIAAGAVLVTALAAVLVGAVLFLEPGGLYRLLEFAREHVLRFFLTLSLYLIFSLAFIFLLPRGRDYKDGSHIER